MAGRRKIVKLRLIHTVEAHSEETLFYTRKEE